MSARGASPAAMDRAGVSRPIRSVPCSMRFTGAAKADPGRRFHALYDKVCRRDVLQRAWAVVRRNNGASGIESITLAAVEEFGSPGCSMRWPAS